VKAIVELPAATDSTTNLPYVFFSTCHWKPIFNGFSGFFPKKYSNHTKKMNKFPEYESLDFMKDLEISHVVLHLANLEENKQKPLLEAVEQNNKLEIEYYSDKDYLVALDQD